MVKKTPAPYSRAPRRLLSVLALSAALAGQALVGLSTPGSAAEPHSRQDAPHAKRSAGSLLVSPGSLFTAGQRLLFSGDLGVRGVRRVHLQQHMGRTGDVWGDVEGFSTMTKADGSFSFAYPAPSMRGISLRVAGKGVATSAWDFEPMSQDLTLSTGRILGLDENEVLQNVPFTIVVDTTPTLLGRPDLPAPVIVGRTLTLQQRVNGDQWKTLDTTRTGLVGNGAFTRTLTDPGYVTYRVRQEDWTRGGDKIGWYPSFPFTVRVVDPRHPDAGRRPAGSAPSRPLRAEGGASSRGGQTAAKIHQWGVSLWDFAWTSGQSLTSKPFRGTDLRGWWLDGAAGTGRVAPLNGQLALDSGRNFRGAGDQGTTRATLQDNPMAYGRWETAFRIKRFETGARDYHAVLELVPDRTSDYRCGTRTITVADIDAGGRTLAIGANSASGTRWTATRSINIGTRSAALGIEVTRSHITWFVDGRTIGVVRDPRAVSGVPMTLRLSLVGDGDQEMDHTQLLSDWQRAWDLGRGKQVTKGAPLKRGSYDASC